MNNNTSQRLSRPTEWVRSDAWNLTNNADDNNYIRAVLKVLFGDNKLINRSLDQKRCKFQAENKSSRRQFTSEEINHKVNIVILFILFS